MSYFACCQRTDFSAIKCGMFEKMKARTFTYGFQCFLALARQCGVGILRPLLKEFWH